MIDVMKKMQLIPNSIIGISSKSVTYEHRDPVRREASVSLRHPFPHVELMGYARLDHA